MNFLFLVLVYVRVFFGRSLLRSMLARADKLRYRARASAQVSFS
jgi:hypothetical protein